MKAKGLFITLLILVLAIASFFAVNSFSSKNEAEVQASEAGSRLTELSPADIDRICYRFEGVTYEFVRQGQEWLYPADPDFPLKQRLIRKMADAAEKLLAVHRISDGAADAQAYGLAEPQCVLELSASGGSSFRLDIGSASSLPKGYYARIPGDNAVYVVDKEAECYLLGLPDLAQQDDMPYIKNLSVLSFTITDGEGSFTFTHKPDGDPDFYDPNILWFMDNEDGELIAGSNSAIREMFNTLNAMETKGCAAYPYEEAELSAYGLENGGLATISIRYLDNDGVEKVLALEAGTAEAGHPEIFSYIHFVGSPLICYARTEDLQNSFLGGKNALLSRDVCVVDYESVLEMELTIDGERYLFTSEKEDTVNQFGYNVVNSTFFLDGEKVDSEYFRVLQSGFSVIDAEAFAPDGNDFDDAPAYIRIVYTTDTMDHQVLEFVPYNANFYLARFGGRNDMLVGTTSVRLAVQRMDNLLRSMEIGEEMPEI